MKATEVITRAAHILNDDDPLYVRWTKPELFRWLNDGATAIVERKPSALMRFAPLELEDGALQRIPPDGIQLIAVVRNLPGRAITKVFRALMDEVDPLWYDGKRASRILHYMQDDSMLKPFYVYPPAREGIRIEICYSASPPEVTEEEDELLLAREYISPLVSFVLYRALSKDSEYANPQLAALHLQAFNEALGSATAVATASKPETGND
ncbi:MAG: DUF6682 family protein [Enterobacteriaceae bacterium]